TATFSGTRTFWVPEWLYTSRCRPSRSVTASVPELGLGRFVSASLPQLLPPSCDHVSYMPDDCVRPIAWSLLCECTRMLGWMALMPGSWSTIGVGVQVLPLSTLRSK